MKISVAGTGYVGLFNAIVESNRNRKDFIDDKALQLAGYKKDGKDKVYTKDLLRRD